VRRFTKHSASKLLIVLLLSLISSILLTGCTKSDADKYASAQKLLAEGKYQEAIDAFSLLGNYEESSKYIMYIKAVQLAEDSQFEPAINSFASLEGFKDSKLMAIYYGARKLEAEQAYEEAGEVYKSIATFKDSLERDNALPDLILHREFSR